MKSHLARFTSSSGESISVVLNAFSHGSDEGLYEVAVLDSDGAIVGDVQGWVSLSQAAAILRGLGAVHSADNDGAVTL